MACALDSAMAKRLVLKASSRSALASFVMLFPLYLGYSRVRAIALWVGLRGTHPGQATQPPAMQLPRLPARGAVRMVWQSGISW